MDGLSPELQLEERSPSDLLMYDPRAGSVELQGLQSGDQEAEVGHFPATQDVLDTSDWISTLTQSPFSPLPQVHHNQPFRGGVHDANSVPGAADDLAPAALARSPDQPLSYTGPNLDFSVPSTPACDDAPVSHPGGGNPAACRTSVLLFNELGSTYMCSISEGNGHITEYYRATFGGNRGPWEIVERSDAAKTAMHQEAGVPKSVPWPGPALIVFAQGKQEVGKGGILNQPTRKYYQWCKTCCSVTCASAIRGCTKAKCWIAPRKWKRHVATEQLRSIQMGHRLTQGAKQHPAAASHANANPTGTNPPDLYGAEIDHAGAPIMSGRMSQHGAVPRGMHSAAGAPAGMQQRGAGLIPPHDLWGAGGHREGAPGAHREHPAEWLERHDPRHPGMQRHGMATSLPVAAQGMPQGGGVGSRAMAGAPVARLHGDRWHSKLQELQSENSALRGRVDSLNSMLQTLVRDDPRGGGVAQPAVRPGDHLDEYIASGFVGRDEPLWQLDDVPAPQAGKRELLTMQSESAPAAADGPGEGLLSGAGGGSCEQDSKRSRVSALGAVQQREVLLVFNGYGGEGAGDLQALSGKLNRLKRLLVKRFDATRGALAPPDLPPQDLLLLRILFNQPCTSLATRLEPAERVRVLVAAPLTRDAQDHLRDEIVQVCAFVADVQLDERAICFHLLAADEGASVSGVPGRSCAVQVVVVGFNHGAPGEKPLDDMVLSELCQLESVSWSLCGAEVSIGWVQRDVQYHADGECSDARSAQVVCNPAKPDASISLYFPAAMRAFFHDASLHKAFEAANFLGKVLASDVGFVDFLERRHEVKGANL